VSKRARTTVSAGPARCAVTVCRGCCCGTPASVPHLDHEAQLTDLRTTLAGVAAVRRVDCLDACARANVVVVVQPSAEGRRGAVLESVRVAQEHRGTGVGTALNAAFLAWARRRGATEATPRAYAGNTTAVAFYRSRGYLPHHVNLCLPLPA
jgi:GNAT superfamily N-acetyltransferase